MEHSTTTTTTTSLLMLPLLVAPPRSCCCINSCSAPSPSPSFSLPYTQTCAFFVHTKDTQLLLPSSSSFPSQQPAGRRSLKFFSEWTRDVAPSSDQKFIASPSPLFYFEIILKLLGEKKLIICILGKLCRVFFNEVLFRTKHIMNRNSLLLKTLLLYHVNLFS